jgi:hypothetical protein
MPAPAKKLTEPSRADRGDEGVLEAVLAGNPPQLVRASAGDDLSAGHHYDMVAKERDLLHDVAREQHRGAVVPQSANEVAHRPDRGDVEAARRLVEEHVLRPRRALAIDLHPARWKTFVPVEISSISKPESPSIPRSRLPGNRGATE